MTVCDLQQIRVGSAVVCPTKIGGTHMHRFRLMWIVAAALFVAAPAARAAQDDSATVGWFLREIAIARALPAPTEAGAAGVLKAAGVSLPSLDPSKALTEQDVVAIGKSFGINSTTRAPNAPFT